MIHILKGFFAVKMPYETLDYKEATLKTSEICKSAFNLCVHELEGKQGSQPLPVSFCNL